MDDERYAMWTRGVEHFRAGIEPGFDYIDHIQHGGGKYIQPGTAFEQVIGDLLVAHVCGGAEGSFKIAAAPIPGGVDEGGFCCEHFFDTRKISMRNTDKFFNKV